MAQEPDRVQRDGRSNVIIDAETDPDLHEHHLQWQKIWRQRSSPMVYLASTSNDRRRAIRALGSLVDLAGDSFHRRGKKAPREGPDAAILGDWARIGEDLWSSMERLVEDAPSGRE